MSFKIDSKRIWELVQIEEEVNCNIGAAVDVYLHQNNSNLSADSYLDRNKLVDLLQGELGEVLLIEDIDAIVNIVQEQIRMRIDQRKIESDRIFSWQNGRSPSM
jgi:hypothetical protein